MVHRPPGGDPVTETTIVPAIEYQTFHARWTRTEQIVTYDPNGGSCTTETQIQTIGQPYADLPAATLEHYVLAGWYTAPDGGDLVDGTTTVTAADTRTLYAHWTRVDQIVTFDPNGGSCNTETRIYTIGQPYDTLPTATLEHYVLDGWYTHPYYGDRVDEITPVSSSGTLTLYAHWRCIEQIVTFDPNGGTCDTETCIYTIGEPYASLPDATREHYILEGWYTQRYEGTRVDETTIVSATDTLTLYAYWTRVDQIVTFDPNGGIGDVENRIYTIGQPYGTLPSAILDHFAFAGWYTLPQGGNRIDSTATVTTEDTRTLYAHWKRFLETEIKPLDDCQWSIDTLTLSFSGEKGRIYALERAQSLEGGGTWFMLDTLEVEQDGEYTFITCLPGGRNGFYRIAEVNPYLGVQLWEGGPYWAEENIGAKQPWEYGYYFWWGDTVGYVWKNDAWVASDGLGTGFSFSETNTPTYGKDHVTLLSEDWITSNDVLAPEHDAVQVQWGGGWRLPTWDEVGNLCDKCDWTWTLMNGVYGYVVCGRGDFSDSSIFIPAAGCGYGTSLYNAGSNGHLWSSNLSDEWDDLAVGLYFESGNSMDYSYYSYYYGYRSTGHSIRPVRASAE